MSKIYEKIFLLLFIPLFSGEAIAQQLIFERELSFHSENIAKFLQDRPQKLKVINLYIAPKNDSYFKYKLFEPLPATKEAYSYKLNFNLSE